MFHRSWAAGHNDTNYPRFLSAAPGEIYAVETYSSAFEPYMIFSRDAVPWCDERFVGYGANKAACVFAQYISGTKFYVLGDDFLIHQNHPYAEETRRVEVIIEQINLHGRLLNPTEAIQP